MADHSTKLHLDIELPPVETTPHEGRFKDVVPDHIGTWSPETHAETSVEKDVRQTLNHIHLIGGALGTFGVLFLLVVGVNLYHRVTYVDSVKPDYSSLYVESSTYWKDRILLDIATALQSQGTDQIRNHRLQRFAQQTMTEAMSLSAPYARAQAVTSVAMTLAQHDIIIPFERALQQLGTTELIAAMRARTLISQSLMHLRLKHTSSARNAMMQYHRLVLDVNLKLNSPLNEESFFGAVTVLKCLDDGDRLNELINDQKNAIAVMSEEQRMKAYRLIAGEQARIGMTLPALQTAGQIVHPEELARALALIIYYTARPPRIMPVEPSMLDVPLNPPTEPLVFPRLAEETVEKILQFLAENKDIAMQGTLLQRLANSRLMCDGELQKIFRHCIIASEGLDEIVKKPVLQLLDNPESPTIRSALKLPPRPETASKVDTATDDWTVSVESIILETADIDSTPLRSRKEQQRIQALLAIAQGYQSVRRFQDADRILKQTFVETQRIAQPNVRSLLLMQIGEQQISVGSIADARQTLTVVTPILNSNQKSELARLYVIARLFDDAQVTISALESTQLREYACSFLFRELIRIHDLPNASKILTRMPQSKTAEECRCLLNIAQAKGNRNDYKTLELSFPDNDNQNWEQHCIELIRQGLLLLASQTAERIGDRQKRADILTRIAQDYQLLYQSFNDTNDADHIIRQSIQKTIVSIAERTNLFTNQTAILSELLFSLAHRAQNDADRATAKQILTQAINACRRITEPEKSAVLFAKLIAAKNILDITSSAKDNYPLFTRETNRLAFDDSNGLIEECLKLVNSSTDEEQRGYACIYLADALAQVGRTASAQALHKRALDISMRLSNRQKSVPMLLEMIPAIKAMDSPETATMIYRLAIDEVIRDFSTQPSNVDDYEWRMRESEIEWIVRSQMENGYLDDAVESAARLKEPMLRDRLLRTAIYIYLDQGELFRAELEARRLTVKHIQDKVLDNIQIIKNRLAIESKTLVPDP